VVAQLGIAPDLALGGRFYSQVERIASSRWQPSGRLAVDYVQSDAFAAGNGSAQTQLAAGRLDLCPARFATVPQLVTALCARGEFGELRAVGSGVARASSARGLWTSAGAVARVEWTPVGALRLDLEGGAVAPFLSHSIVLSPPRMVVYTLPAVVPSIALGVGMTFP
jgi:hypothetical protein